MFSHFSIGYVVGFPTARASGFVSIFFLLSDFGIYTSLKRRSNLQQ